MSGAQGMAGSTVARPTLRVTVSAASEAAWGRARSRTACTTAWAMGKALSVLVLGDESGYSIGKAQKTKMAALEAMWETEPAPAGLNLIAIPNEAEMKNDFAIEIPWVMGLIGTRSLDRQIPGIREIKLKNRERIVSGIEAVKALDLLRKNPGDSAAKVRFEAHKADLGFGLLLKKYVADVRQATPAMIDQAAADTIPQVAPMFWAFRLMVGAGIAITALFGLALWSLLRNQLLQRTWLLRALMYAIPLPWVAIEEAGLAFKEVRQLHHLHVWRYSDDTIMLDAHIVVDSGLTAKRIEELDEEIAACLKEKFAINHVTLQAECSRGLDEDLLSTNKEN